MLRFLFGLAQDGIGPFLLIRLKVEAVGADGLQQAVGNVIVGLEIIQIVVELFGHRSIANRDLCGVAQHVVEEGMQVCGEISRAVLHPLLEGRILEFLHRFPVNHRAPFHGYFHHLCLQGVGRFLMKESQRVVLF